MEESQAKELLKRVLTAEQFKRLLEYLILVTGAKAFTAEERQLIEWYYRLPPDEVWEKLRSPLIFCGIHYLLFLYRPKAVYAIDTVSKNFLALKKLLDQPGSASPRKLDELLIETTPIGSVVEHDQVGKAVVTKHAWIRFCARAPYGFSNPGTLGAMLRSSFSAAKPYELPPHVRVKRIIDSRFTGAQYLFDQRLKLRYVLSEDRNNDGCHQLITVEQPKISLVI